MPKRVQIALAGLIMTILGVFAWQVLHEREPVYQGKRLSVWLEQYGTNHWSGGRGDEVDTATESAIRQIGTNAIPIYLEMMASKESSLTIKLLSSIPSRWFGWAHLPSSGDYRHKVEMRRRLGAYAFIALDRDAKPAVPALIALLNDKHPDVRYVAVFALRSLGPVASDALPSLIKCLDDPEFTVRDDAVMGLGTIQEQPQRVIPILIQFVEKNRAERILCRDAMDSLRMFGGKAKASVPTLVGLLDDSVEDIRSAATNALLTIDPEAAARSGVK
jgi:hypothetical protein